MSAAYIVEVDGLAAGLVMRDRGGFRFHAAHTLFQALEGRVFKTPEEATRAAKATQSERADRRRDLPLAS